jgi:hypothetical protein
VGPRSGREGIGHVVELLVTCGVTGGVVDGLLPVEIDEGDKERLLVARGSVHVPLELQETRTPEIGAGERVDRRVLPFPGRRSPIGRRRGPVVFGFSPFAGTSPAIGERGVAVVPGPRPLAGAGSAIPRRAAPVGGGFPAGERRAEQRVRSPSVHGRLGSFGGPVPGLGGFVALVRGHVSSNGKLVALAGRLVALGAGVVAHMGDVIPLVAVDISLIAGLIALARTGVQTHDASPCLAVGVGT